MKPLRRSSSSPTSNPLDKLRDDGFDLSRETTRDEQKKKTDIKDTISILETRGKKLCSDLRTLQMDRAELTREVELLSQHLENKRGRLEAKSDGRTRRCHKQFTECVPCEEYGYISMARRKSEYDWSEILNWPNLYALEIASAGLENKILKDCEGSHCKSCSIDWTCNRKDTAFPRCSRMKQIRTRNLCLSKTRSCRWCRADKCKGDDLPAELEWSRFIDEYNCACAAYASLNVESSSSCSYELEADSSFEFPASGNVSMHECAYPLEIDEPSRMEQPLETLKCPRSLQRDPKNLSKNCSCLLDREDSKKMQKKCAKCSRNSNNDRENVGELRATVQILQQKCRTKDDVIAALIDEFKRDVSVDRVLRSLPAIDSKRQVCRFEPKNLTNRYEARKRDVFVGLLLLLSMVIPILLRLYKYVSLEIASVLDYLGHWTQLAVLQFQMSPSSHELFSRLTFWIRNGVSVIVYSCSTVLNEYFLSIYTRKRCLLSQPRRIDQLILLSNVFQTKVLQRELDRFYSKQ